MCCISPLKYDLFLEHNDYASFACCSVKFIRYSDTSFPFACNCVFSQFKIWTKSTSVYVCRSTAQRKIHVYKMHFLLLSEFSFDFALEIIMFRRKSYLDSYNFVNWLFATIMFKSLRNLYVGLKNIQTSVRTVKKKLQTHNAITVQANFDTKNYFNINLSMWKNEFECQLLFARKISTGLSGYVIHSMQFS